MSAQAQPQIVVRPDPVGAHSTPGVRLESLDTAPQVRSVLRTDVAGFVGVAERGPLHRAVRVRSWDQFRGMFGGQLPHAYLGFAMEAFFANGGTRCWVVRVADPKCAKTASAWVCAPGGGLSLLVTASSPGRWGNEIECRAEVSSDGLGTLELRRGTLRETWRRLALHENARHGRDPVQVLNHRATGSRLVTVAWGRPAPESNFARLSGGADGLETLAPEHFADKDCKLGVHALDLVDEISLVSVPDCWTPPARPHRSPRFGPCGWHPRPVPERPPRPVFGWKEAEEVQQAVVRHCDQRRDRVALLDAPPRGRDGGWPGPRDVLAWRNKFRSPYAALYHPWVVVPDGRPGGRGPVPPSGHVAGLCAHGDRTVGMHRAPAGQVLKLAADTVCQVGEVERGELDQAGVNVIKAARGVRVLGNRTLGKGQWCELNVRRLVIGLEEQIRADTAWTVFEPCTLRLCGELERVVQGVLYDAWQRGLLEGPSPAEAYSVCCDAAVNPPVQLAEGRLVCLIRLRPPPPAESIVVRLLRTPAGVLVEQPGGDRV